MKLRKLAGIILAAALTVTAGISANAESYTKDGLTTEIIADNNYYEADDVAKIVVKVTNNNDFAVTDVSLESVLPEGLVLVEGSETSCCDDTLEAGETVKFTMLVAKDSSEDEENTGDIKEEVNPEIMDNETSGDKADASAVEDDDKNPDTGSQAGATAAAIMVIAALGFVLVCMVTRKNKKASKALSIAVCAVFAVSGMGQLKAAAETESASFTMTGIVCFDKTNYELTVETTYDSVNYDQAKTYTRAEWVKLIADTQGITADGIEEETVEWFYGDTMGTEDGILVEYLHAIGVIPAPDNEGYVDAEQDVALFEGDKEVTREFAVYTAVNALGFMEEEAALTCTDAEAITYKSEVTTALKFNMLSLIDGAFKPDELIHEGEKSQIIAVMSAMNEVLVTDEDEVAHEVTYAQGVIADELSEMTDYTAVENSDGTYTVTVAANDVTKAFAEGTIFVLPANDEYTSGASFKVASVSVNGDSVVAICTVPEMEEVVSAVYMKDTVTADVGEFIPAEGVTAQILDSSELSGDAAPLDFAQDFDSNTELSVSTEIADDCELGLTFAIPRVSVAYRSHTDWDWFNTRYVVDEVLCVFTQKIDVEVEGTIASTEDLVDPKKLGTLPITLPAGFKINVTFYAYLEADATVSIGYTVESTAGIHYINGSFRNPANTNGYFDKAEVGGSFKVGPMATINLTWTIVPDLIGAEIKTGLGGEAVISAHPEANLVCINLSLYVPLTLSVSHDSVVGKIMDEANIELSCDIFDADSSPFKARIHIENLRMVDDCTYGNGKISVVVKGEGNVPLSGAKVIIKRTDGSFVANSFTDSNGKLVVDGVEPGQVTVQVKATGYMQYDSRELVRPLQTTYMEAVLMVLREGDEDSSEDENGENNVSGTVKNAVTGNFISADFVVRAGSNASESSEVIAQGTSQNGKYSVDLPYGYYTITFTKNGYVDNSVNVVVNRDSATVKNVVLSPELDSVDSNEQLRIVLTWGRNPYDLDSHLLGSSSTGYHVYYRVKNYYEDGELKANLDVDDTSSYGPETVTIYTIEDGENFSYYVHDFSNRYNSDSTVMSNSEAKVVVYSGENVVGIFNVPIDVEGNLWHVFDYDSETGEITPVNTFSKIGSSEYSDYFIDRY